MPERCADTDKSGHRCNRLDIHGKRYNFLTSRATNSSTKARATTNAASITLEFGRVDASIGAHTDHVSFRPHRLDHSASAAASAAKHYPSKLDGIAAVTFTSACPENGTTTPATTAAAAAATFQHKFRRTH